MPKYATVRDLKNQTTALIREVEKKRGRIVVTRRGRPVATLKAFEPNDLRAQDKYSTIAFEALRKRILAKYPHLARETPEQASREFERITRKMRRNLPFKSWQEMERFAKGDIFGLTR